MPVYTMDIWSGIDLGMGGNTLGTGILSVFQNGGSFTVQGAPDNMAVFDDDPDFDDDPNVISPPEIPDPGLQQVLNQNLSIDGNPFGTALDQVYAAATSTFINTTTGQIGELIYVTLLDGLGGTFVGFASTIALNIGDGISVESGSFIASVPYTDLVCFTDDACVKTKRGVLPISQLAKGDLVKTRDNGFQPVRVVATRTLNLLELTRYPHLWPIQIRPGAAGFEGLTAPLTVSPQHRFVHRSPLSSVLYGHNDVLVPAKALLGQPYVEQMAPTQAVTYYHIIFDDHQIIFANGVQTESLLLTPRTFNSLADDQVKEEVALLFPDLLGDTPQSQKSSMPSLTGKEAELLYAH